MNLFHRIICLAAAGLICVTAAGCSSEKTSDDAKNSASQSASAAKSKKDKSDKSTTAEETQEEETQAEAESETFGEQTAEDHSEELEIISKQTDVFLTALKDGDVQTVAGMLEPGSKYYEFFQRHRDSEQLSLILKTDFADLVWTHWSETDLDNKNWLENTYIEHGDHTRSFVCAGVREMLYFGEYFLLNFEKGKSVDNEMKLDSEGAAIAYLENTLAKMPLCRNTWALNCTLPSDQGTVWFNLDDDYLMDYTNILAIDNSEPTKMAQDYVDLLVTARGVIEDDSATFDDSTELRAKYSQLLREKDLEGAWKYVQGLDEDSFYAAKTTYDDLADVGQQAVDEFVAEHLDIVVTDYSTKVYDGTRRRHVFTQMYYDCIPEDNEDEIADWLAENGVKQSCEAVFFDITEDGRLANALSGYFDVIAKLGE